MNQKYNDCVEQISQILFQAITEREENLVKTIGGLDSDLLSLLRTIGARVMSMLMAWLVNQVTSQTKTIGWVIHRRPKIKYTVIFGQLKIESPYLWNKRLKKGIRPVAEKLGIRPGKRSLAVKRALSEFGAEESFGQAAKRFQDHYGFWVEGSAVRREVEKIAQLAEEYVEQKLKTARKNSLNNLSKKTYRILLELDGCQIRTGLHFPSPKAELTPKRQLKKKLRTIDWREVRVGLARPVDHKDQRTFVAKKGKYPQIIEQLVGAANDQGLCAQSQVYAIADGAKGLREALDKQFADLKFILDRPHLKQHIYENADARGLTGEMRQIWIDSVLYLIEHGKVKSIISRLKSAQGPGEKSSQNLAEYLERFKDAVHYQREFDGVKNERVMAGKGLKGKGERNEKSTFSRFPFPLNQNKNHV